MNALERLLWKRDEQPGADAEARAYARDHRDGLWHAAEAIKQTQTALGMDRMNADGSFRESDQ